MNIPAEFTLLKEQPPSVEFYTADGIFLKQIHSENTGTLMPQHSHVYDHSSALVSGSVRVWKDDMLLGDFFAPTVIYITAKTKHTFLTLEPNTTIYCIHNVSRAGEVEIHEEHQLGGH